EALRTHFGEIDGEPWQVIGPTPEVQMQVEDLQGMEALQQKGFVMKGLAHEARDAFDLGRGPLMRVRLLKLREQEHVLLRTMHHIVSDGWSEGIFSRELELLYEAYCEGRESPLKALAVQYSDFAVWQRSLLKDAALEEGLKYWREQLL